MYFPPRIGTSACEGKENATQPDTLPNYVRRVLEAIGAEPISYQNHSIEVHASGGLIPLPFAGLEERTFDWGKTVQIADLAMYKGKTHGRNCAIGVLDFNVPLEEAAPAIFRDLGEAIENGWVESRTVQVVRSFSEVA